MASALRSLSQVGGVRLDSAHPILRLQIESHRKSYYQRLVNVSLSPSQIVLHSSPRSTKAFGRGILPSVTLVAKSWRVSVAPSVALGARFLLIQASHTYLIKGKGLLLILHRTIFRELHPLTTISGRQHTKGTIRDAGVVT